MAKAATTKRVSSVSDFKKKVGGLTELPSGLFVKIRNTNGLRGFLQSGMIPNSLMPIIQEAISKGTEPDMSKIVGEDNQIDPKMIADMMQMMDQVTMSVVTEPKFQPAPEDEDDRDDDTVYIDELDDEDKMFIFQLITGGTRDLERFRQELTAGVEHLANIKIDPGPTKQPARSRK